MSVKTLTYRDLTPRQRTQAALKMRGKLLGFLNNPFLTVPQRNSIYAKVALLEKWEKLALDVAPLRPEPAPAILAWTPMHHDVTLTDRLGLGEKVS
jgi:hypothetical protein